MWYWAGISTGVIIALICLTVIAVTALKKNKIK